MAAALGGQRQSPKVSDAAVKHGGNRRVGRCEQKRTDTDRRPGTGGASAEVQVAWIPTPTVSLPSHGQANPRGSITRGLIDEGAEVKVGDPPPLQIFLPSLLPGTWGRRVQRKQEALCGRSPWHHGQPLVPRHVPRWVSVADGCSATCQDRCGQVDVS